MSEHRHMVHFPRASGLVALAQWAMKEDELVSAKRVRQPVASRDDEALGLFDAPSTFIDEAHRADAAAFFGERARRQDGAPRQLANALEEVALCIERKRLQGPSVEAFLRQQAP